MFSGSLLRALSIKIIRLDLGRKLEDLWPLEVFGQNVHIYEFSLLIFFDIFSSSKISWLSENVFGNLPSGLVFELWPADHRHVGSMEKIPAPPLKIRNFILKFKF